VRRCGSREWKRLGAGSQLAANHRPPPPSGEEGALLAWGKALVVTPLQALTAVRVV